MATPEIIENEKDMLLYSSIFGHPDEPVKSRGAMIERKIEILESMACNVGNRRSRRLLNDRLLMELVPRLNAEEIRGLFAPPPWGEEHPVSPFCLTNVGEWDRFRNIDMDKEANFMQSVREGPHKRNPQVDSDKIAIQNAWHRINCRTREAVRRSFLPDLIEGYEQFVRAFIQNGENSDVLVLQVQDPFHRLLLHGVCEFYDVVSVTETTHMTGSKVVRQRR